MKPLLFDGDPNTVNPLVQPFVTGLVLAGVSTDHGDEATGGAWKGFDLNGLAVEKNIQF